MIEYIVRIWQWINRSAAQGYELLRGLDYAEGWKTTKVLLTTLPGLLAWTVEVVALSGAVICVWLAARQGSTLATGEALALSVLAGTLVGLAILTDYYTSSPSDKQGGGK